VVFLVVDDVTEVVAVVLEALQVAAVVVEDITKVVAVVIEDFTDV
jgi:hypothetical protein